MNSVISRLMREAPEQHDPREVEPAGGVSLTRREVAGCVAVVALALAFFCYNRGLPLTIRSAFYPIFGKATWGWPGHIIDILAVFATLFGLATSLGIGANQAAGGMKYLFGISDSNGVKVLQPS